MSQNNTTPLINIPDIPEPMVQAITDTFNDLSTPARQNVGAFLGDISYCVFGKLHTHVLKRKIDDASEVALHQEKVRIKQENDLKNYLMSICETIESTPDDKLLDPRLDIIGPAIEASKYYISNKEIRDMFVKLIGASINSDTSNQVHHSFVEIIKQLSPLDASNLKVLSNGSSYPIVSYKAIVNDQKSYRTVRPLIWIYSETNKYIEDNAISITNLVRLGLAETPEGTYSHSIDYDQLFKEQPSFKLLSESIDKINNNTTVDLSASDIELLKGAKYLDIEKGIVSLTPLGKAFTRICC